MESETKLHYDKIYDDDGGVDVDIDTTSDESSDDSSDYSGGDSDGHDQNEERPQRNVVYDSEYESIENSGSDSEGETPIKGFTFTLPSKSILKVIYFKRHLIKNRPLCEVHQILTVSPAKRGPPGAGLFSLLYSINSVSLMEVPRGGATLLIFQSNIA